MGATVDADITQPMVTSTTSVLTTAPVTTTSTSQTSDWSLEDAQVTSASHALDPTPGEVDEASNGSTWVAGIVLVGILLSIVCGVVCTLRKVQATDAQSPFRTTWGTICFFLFQSLSLSSASRAKKESESSTLL